jgi:hypothetical protein
MSDSHCAPGKKVVYLQISISTIERVDALLYDQFRGKRQKNKRNDLVEELLKLWIREEERRRGISSDILAETIRETRSLSAWAEDKAQRERAEREAAIRASAKVEALAEALASEGKETNPDVECP